MLDMIQLDDVCIQLDVWRSVVDATSFHVALRGFHFTSAVVWGMLSYMQFL